MTQPEIWLQRIAWLSLAVFSVLWLARWPMFPLVLDPYYHLLIAQQVADAGGPIAYEWWQYAPGGRPHLYPPILHVGLAGLLTAGVSPLTAIRLFSVALLPLLLLSLYHVMKRLFYPSLALTCLWIAMVPFGFHLHTAITLAATLALIELLWLLYAVECGRWMAAALLFALLSYTHLGLPWISLVTLLLYGCLRPGIWLQLWKVALGLLLAAPWWWHLLSHREALHPVSRYENQLLECMPLLMAAACLGVWVCWRRRGRWLLLLACGLGFSVMAYRYLFRWLNGEGYIPIILLAAVGVDWLSQRMARVASGHPRQVVMSACLVGVLCIGPGVARSAGAWQGRWLDSAPFHFLGAPWVSSKELEMGFAVHPIMKIVEVVRNQTAPGEILWSNASYALGFVTALTHRAMSSAMLSEVSATQAFDPLEAAHVILWFKFDPLPGQVSATRLSRLRLNTVFEDEMVVIYRRQDLLPFAHEPRAVMPLCGALGIVLAVVGGVVRDLGGRRGRARHSELPPV